MLKDVGGVHIISMNLDFLEIGTSNFDTLLQTCSQEQIGMSVEPIQYYLDTLPNRDNVTKMRYAITANRTTDTIKIYYIPEHTLKVLNLPWWLKGCNSINKYHPMHKEYKVESLVVIEDVPLINIDEFLVKYNIKGIQYLKIDTEGHDCVILNGLFDYLKTKSREYYPLKILFETNANTTKEDIEATIEHGKRMGYTVISTGTDTLLELKSM